jgi:hypothetical protein
LAAKAAGGAPSKARPSDSAQQLTGGSEDQGGGWNWLLYLILILLALVLIWWWFLRPDALVNEIEAAPVPAAAAAAHAGSDKN